MGSISAGRLPGLAVQLHERGAPEITAFACVGQCTTPPSRRAGPPEAMPVTHRLLSRPCASNILAISRDLFDPSAVGVEGKIGTARMGLGQSIYLGVAD